jgi:plasmid stabilization system protein ParE
MTTRGVVLRPEAARDIEEARDWYDAQEPDLGAEFIEEIDATLARVAQLPGGYALVEDDVRRALVRRFPYGVFFVDDGDSIAVLAVFHLAMSPTRLGARVRANR